MPEREIEKTIPKATSNDARLTALETWQATAMDKLDEIHAAVVGAKGGKEAGMGELVRDLQKQVAFLYGLAKWSAGLLTAAILGLWTAWLNSGRPGSH